MRSKGLLICAVAFLVGGLACVCLWLGCIDQRENAQEDSVYTSAIAQLKSRSGWGDIAVESGFLGESCAVLNVEHPVGKHWGAVLLLVDNDGRWRLARVSSGDGLDTGGSSFDADSAGSNSGCLELSRGQ